MGEGDHVLGRQLVVMETPGLGFRQIMKLHALHITDDIFCRNVDGGEGSHHVNCIVAIGFAGDCSIAILSVSHRCVLCPGIAVVCLTLCLGAAAAFAMAAAPSGTA